MIMVGPGPEGEASKANSHLHTCRINSTTNEIRSKTQVIEKTFSPALTSKTAAVKKAKVKAIKPMLTV